MKKLLLTALLITFGCHAMDYSQEALQVAQIGLGCAAASYTYNTTAEWLSNKVDRNYTSILNNRKPWQSISGYMEKRGVLGAWWIGVPLIAAARLGSHPMDAHELIKPVVIAYGAAAAFSLITGMISYAKGVSRANSKESSIETSSMTAFLAGFATPTSLIGYILYKRFTH